MALNSLTSGSPLDGFFSKHMPQFFTEKFSGSDLQRIEAFFSNLDIIFDNIYQKIKDFPNQLDIRNAEVQYLYELAQLIGLTEIEDLSNYLDSDGNVDTSILTQAQYDALLIQQKTYIANTLVRLLLKGTSESIIRILQSHGVSASIRELWAEDTINGPYFEYDNDLVTRYGNAITGATSGDVYSEEQPIDIISEISLDVPAASGISDILQYEQNKYGYKYLLDDNYDLYFKTSTIVSLSGTSEDTWYKYDNSVLSISGDIAEFKLSKDKIYLRTDINDLAVLDYQLDDLTITPDFSIDDNDCLFFDFIEDNDYFFLDRDSTIEIRNTINFQRLAAAISKPVSNTEQINQIIYKENKEYLLINNNKKGYILNIDTLAETYNLNSPATVYDLLIDTNENYYKAFRIEDNEFTILKYDTTTNILKASFLYFDNSDVLSSSSLIISSNFTEINDFYQYFQNVLILGNTKLGIYNIKQKTINEYDYVTTGYNYKKVFLLDKFYFKRFVGLNLDLTKITGWNSFKEYLFKSHYFDLTVGVDVLTDIIDLGITSSTLKTFINDIVDLAKPIHTEFNLITILADAIVDEEILIGSDSLSEVPVISGGPTFTLTMTAKYDGVHPWKRSNNQPLKYNNDGQDGRPLLKYGQTSFDFEADTTNTDLDNLIYYNTPLP